ncbi:LysR family transcriptional regulator [uncultured Friedmanniella sp.]|uniref:LysR family transcriptional regulator n=1 Tax=uncultured Friedmanniella sp. TaxID=335381 RepID=UPI0035CB4D17
MPGVNLRNLDLNLLLTLEALLHERNVTRAAERLGLSQPAVSAALGRLRRHFDDELLRRQGNRYELTPLGAQLGERTSLAVASLQRVFDAAPDFDPATAVREFTVLVSDYTAAVLGDHLVTAMAAQAPGVRLQLRQHTPDMVSSAADVLPGVDGLILPHGFLTGIGHDDLYEDRWVCVVARDNDSVGDALSMADVARLPWVVTYNRPTAFTPAAQQLRVIGVEPDVRVVVESFLAVPFLVGGTDRIALLQAGLAGRLAEAAGVRVLPCPWEVVPLREAFWWHASLRADPAHRWLRSVLVEAGALVGRVTGS